MSDSSLRERIRGSASHTGGDFETHLAGTAALLRDWSMSPALQRAGLYHSVYGNEFGRASIAPDPAELVREIGAEAEALVRLWCDVDREALVAVAREFAQQPVTLPLRAGGVSTVSARQYLDLIHLSAANTLEISLRSGKPCRRLERLRPLLCAEARALVERQSRAAVRFGWLRSLSPRRLLAGARPK